MKDGPPKAGGSRTMPTPGWGTAGSGGEDGGVISRAAPAQPGTGTTVRGQDRGALSAVPQPEPLRSRVPGITGINGIRHLFLPQPWVPAPPQGHPRPQLCPWLPRGDPDGGILSRAN